jgi:hypothetical protein
LDGPVGPARPTTRDRSWAAPSARGGPGLARSPPHRSWRPGPGERPGVPPGGVAHAGLEGVEKRHQGERPGVPPGGVAHEGPEDFSNRFLSIFTGKTVTTITAFVSTPTIVWLLGADGYGDYAVLLSIFTL